MIELVHATNFVVPEEVKIREFYESIEIKGDDALITDVFDIIIPKNLTNESISIFINPPYTSNNVERPKYFIRICGKSHSRNFDIEKNKFGIKCDKRIIINKTLNPRPKMENAPIILKLTPKDLKLSSEIGNKTHKAVYVHLNYKLERFIKNKGYKTVLIDKFHCQTNEAKPCFEKIGTLFLIVPNEAIIEGQNNLEVKGYIEEDNRLVFQSLNINKNSLFLYKDAVKEKKGLITFEISLILIAMSLGLIFSLLQLFFHKNNTPNIRGWFIFAISCLVLGLGGIYYPKNFVYIGGILLIIGGVLGSLPWWKSNKSKIKLLIVEKIRFPELVRKCFRNLKNILIINNYF